MNKLLVMVRGAKLYNNAVWPGITSQMEMFTKRLKKVFDSYRIPITVDNTLMISCTTETISHELSTTLWIDPHIYKELNNNDFTRLEETIRNSILFKDVIIVCTNDSPSYIKKYAHYSHDQRGILSQTPFVDANERTKRFVESSGVVFDLNTWSQEDIYEYIKLYPLKAIKIQKNNQNPQSPVYKTSVLMGDTKKFIPLAHE